MKAFSKLLIASLKEFARDRTTLSFTIILPLLLVAFFGFAYGGSSSRLRVGLVLDRGVSAHSASIRALRRTHKLSIESGPRGTEMARLRDGTIDAVIVAGRSSRSQGLHGLSFYYDRGNSAVALALRGLAGRLDPSSGKGRPGLHTFASVRGLSNSRLDFVIPGILATAIMWVGIFAAIPLVQQREQQVLRRFAVTPLPRSRLVLAQVMSRLLVSIAQAVFVLAAAKLLFGVPIGDRIGSFGLTVVALAALVILGALSFVAIGYAVAALSSTQSGAHAWAQLLTMPMLLLAGVFFPISVMPVFLKPLIALLPLTYLADALRQSAMNGQQFASLGVDLGALALWVLAPMVIAIRYFRWS